MDKILRIDLLSDLCSGSGDTYNSSIDTDIVYDDFGLPYIPAKRIKGCIRESLLELIEFGVFDQRMMIDLFGNADKESSFSLSDARLEHYSDYVHDLKIKGENRQFVLDLFTYSRTQTAIDHETGTAKEDYLRTKRVLKRGLTFKALLSFNSDLTEEQIDAFTKASEIPLCVIKNEGI